MDIMKKIEVIRKELKKAKEINDKQQGKFDATEDAWHIHESIDDCLHEISAAIGD